MRMQKERLTTEIQNLEAQVSRQNKELDALRSDNDRKTHQVQERNADIERLKSELQRLEDTLRDERCALICGFQL